MQNKKLQLWALGMAGYNCHIEYIPGSTNTCADLLSRRMDDATITDRPEESPEEGVAIDISDNTYEIGVLDSSHFDPKVYASCNPPL